MYVCHESTVSLWWLPGLIQRSVKLHSPLGFQVVILILFGFSLKFASLGSSSLIMSQARPQFHYSTFLYTLHTCNYLLVIINIMLAFSVSL